MMRYIMQEEMQQAGVDQFDGWFGSFAREVNDVELNAAAEYEAVTRLAAFINVPELRRMIGQYMDVVFSDNMPEMQPRRTASGKTMTDKLSTAEQAELLNGRTDGAQDRPYKKVVVENADLTTAQASAFSYIQGLAKGWRDFSKKQRKEAMMSGAPESPIIYEGLANKASLDARLLRGEALAGMEGKAKDDAGSKASRVVNNVLEIYNSHPLANQVIFSDLGMGTVATRSVGEVGKKTSQRYKVFSTLRDVIERLVAGGIPREQIAMVDGSTSKAKRKEVADKMNTGEIRVVIGSSDSLGVGVNMQRNLRAMHHMDAPWMPGELEQRNGRGHRQGNQWNTVLEYRYLTDRLDGRRWQVLAVKDRFIKSFLKANDTDRVIEGDAASDEQSDILQTFAEAAGDPRILIREKLKKKIDALQSKERMHGRAMADNQASIRSLGNQIETRRKTLATIERDGAAEKAAAVVSANAGTSFRMTVDGTTYDTRKDADAATKAWIASNVVAGSRRITMGEYGGHKLFARWGSFDQTPTLSMEFGDTEITGPAGSVASLEAGLRNFGSKVDAQRAELASIEQSRERMQKSVGEPFHMADQLAAQQKALADLEKDISINPVPPPAWLRQGAPIDTETFWNGKPYVVTGHRWTNDGWFVMGERDGKEVEIPYTEAKDKQGITQYEPREFQPAKVLTEAERKTADPQFAEADKVPKSGSFSFQDAAPVKGDAAPVVARLRMVNDTARTMTIGWGPNQPRVRVVHSADMLPDKAKEDPRYRRGHGYYDGTTVYLVAPNLRTRADVLKVLAHEAVGHYGLDRIVDDAIGAGAWDKIASKLDALRKDPGRASARMQGLLAEVERRYRTENGVPADRLTFAREFMAVSAEKGIRSSMFDQVIAAIRAFVRKYIPGLSVSEHELRQLLVRSDKYLRSQQADVATTAAQPAGAFSFAGENARTADRSGLSLAQQMEAMGRDAVPDRFGNVMGSPEETHIATGWHRGADGKWRWEIDDSKAAIKPEKAWNAAAYDGKARLDEVLNHPALFDAYPKLADMKVAAQNLARRTLGHYDPKTNTITLNATLLGQGGEGHDMLKSTLLHEVQHVIQTIEGFARGGNIEDAKTLPEYEQMLGSYSARGLTDPEKLAAHHVYQRLAGETEARNTQERLRMSAADRRAMPPSETQDVYRGDQIVRFNEVRALSQAADVGPVDAMDVGQQTEQDTLVRQAKDWMAGKFEDLLPRALSLLQRRHLTELMAGQAPLRAAVKYDETVQQLDADRAQLLSGAADAAAHPDNMLKAGAAPIAEELREFTHEKGVAGWFGRKSEQGKRLANVMHQATIQGIDPSKAYERLKMKGPRGEMVAWTPQLVKERLAMLKEQMMGRSADDKTAMMDEARSLRSLKYREKKRMEAYPELVAKYQALPTKGKALYQKMRDWYEQVSDATADALEARIMALRGDMAESQGKEIAERQTRMLVQKLRAEFEENKVAGVYFPLSRAGDYWVSYTDRAGDQGFQRFETANAQKKWLKELSQRGGAVLSTGRLDGNLRAKDAPSGTFIADVIATMKKSGAPEKVQDEVYQTFLRTLPEVSMRKHAIHRKATPGFSEDITRGFASNAYHGAHQLARLRYAHKLTSLVDQMAMNMDTARKQPGADPAKIARGDALLGELKRRHDAIMSPNDTQLANTLNGIGFLYYLGASPASALVNLTQNAQVTLPVLGSHHGWGKASRVLGAAVRDAIKTGGNIDRTLRGEELQAYNTLRARGDIDKTQAHTMAGLAEGSLLQANPVYAKVMTGLTYMFHQAEVVNREAAGMAAYRLARMRGDDFNASIQYASDIINGTHFDYSADNRPRIMQGNTARVALQFKNYSASMTWLMYRNLHQAFKGETPEVRRLARRTLTGIMGMTGLLAGVVGLPIINLVAAVAGAAHAVGGDDDEPWDFMTEFRSWLAEHLGDTAAAVIADGAVGQVTGANLASRVSLSDLWFRDSDRALEGKDAFYNYLEGMAGPMAGLAKNLFIGTEMISKGHTWRGVETMLPKFAKDAMKATRFAHEGVNTLRGDPIVPDIGHAAELVQAIGFQPTKVAEQQRLNSALMNYEKFIQDRRQGLMNAFAMAQQAGDTDGRGAALAKIQAFNQKYPEIAIRMSNLQASLRTRAQRSAQSDHGIMLQKKLSARVRQEVGAMAGE